MTESSSPFPMPRYRSDLWRLAIVVGVLIFALLGRRPLSNPDEGRYTEIPREMAASGDYVTPRLNGVKYFEKPPLQYWLSALTFRALGISEFTARFWCAAFAVGGALVTYAAGRALYGRLAGLLAAGVLATSLLYYALSRIILLDLMVAVLIAVALFAFLVALRQPAGSRRRWLFWAFYAAMALAVLTKGLIGVVLPGAVAGLWVLALNRWRSLRPFHPFSGALVFLIIALPWHVLVARANDDFLWFYFVHEHLLRFTTQAHGRVAPWWFFGPILLVGLFPWTAFFFQAVRQGLRGGWRERIANQEAWFLVIWIGFILLFFSKSQSKLIPYILPVFPAAAVLIGRYLSIAWEQHTADGVRRGLLIAAGLGAVLAGAMLLVKGGSDAPMLADLRPWRWVLAIWMLAGAGTVVWTVWRQGNQAALAVLALTTIGFLLLLNPVSERVDRRSTKPLALGLKARIETDDEVYALREYFQDFPAYLQRTVSVVDYAGELQFGIASEPAKTAPRFIGGDEFRRRWTRPGRRFAIARRRDLVGEFAASNFPHVVIGEYRDQVLLTNCPP